MKHIKIDPEVINGLGEQTVFKENIPPFKTIKKLHIELQDWLGDDLVTCHPTFLVSEKLKNRLNSIDQNIVFDEIKLTFSEYFNDNFNIDKEIPVFFMINFEKLNDSSPLFMDKSYNLNIDETLFYKLKKEFSLKFTSILERNEFDDIIDKMIAESKKNR